LKYILFKDLKVTKRDFKDLVITKKINMLLKCPLIWIPCLQFVTIGLNDSYPKININMIRWSYAKTPSHNL
jgi:hypothetical protein